MITYLTSEIRFPNVHQANPDGLLAVGGDLSTERLILAYKKGIFPWFEKNQPILWWSPNPRFVLFPEKLKVSKSMKQVLKNHDFTITINLDFKTVITECAKTKRTGQRGTWITNSMMEAYMKLHKEGIAKSVEVWQNNILVAG
ncbi:MAG TPA: leucyl/phenylalanyl-tRNA--protein transferase, partial [Xanthomarina gelatinilytica]|nr:leucyl/phenylalanyl-tRNA--protein transferase [Xanthomarina gelatinilytica]